MQFTRTPWARRTGGTRIQQPASRLRARRGPDSLGRSGPAAESNEAWTVSESSWWRNPSPRTPSRPTATCIGTREDSSFHTINRGFAKRFDGLAAIDTAAQGGTAAVAIVRARPHALPFNVAMLERHLLGSQAFVPSRRIS
jgi:hypothetical protein